MIVKEKGKRKNGKVWTSLLFHFSLFIFHFSLFIFHFSLFIFHFSLFIFHFSLFAGHPSLTSEKDYVDEFFEIPSKFVDDLAVIPGDADFYQVLSLEDGGTWTVTTNGVTVTNNVAFGPNRMGGDVYPNIPDVVKYHVGYPLAPLMSLGITPTRDYHYGWHPNIFDFAVSNSVGGYIRMTYNGDGMPKAVSQLTGDGDLYHPRSFRLDNHTYMSLLSSYAAYFERLYYASEGQESKWDEGEWGPYGPSADFRFNVTNLQLVADCYFDIGWTNGERTVEGVRKLKEWARLKRLREIMRDDMFRREPNSLLPMLEEVPKEASPDFLARPGWMLISFRGTETEPLWWSSQADPPAIANGDTQTPTTSGFSFFPEFDWTAEPIFIEDSQGNRTPTYDWSDYCVTLNMAREPAHGSYVRHPLAVLFGEVSGWQLDGLDEFVVPYEFGAGDLGIYMWLTNAYPRCVSQYYNQPSAWADYLHGCWGMPGRLDPSRRLVPNDYVGVNQLLGLMDRTIHVPNMIVSSTNDVAYVESTASYTGEVPVVGVRLTDYGGGEIGVEIYRDEEEESDVDFSLIANSRTNEVDTWETDQRGLFFEGDAPDFEIQDIYASTGFVRSVAIDEGFLAATDGGGGTMWVIGVYFAPPPYPTGSLLVEYELNGSEPKLQPVFPWTTNGTSMLPHLDFAVTNLAATLRAGRGYFYSKPKSSKATLGVTQPGKYHSPRRDKESRFGMFSYCGVKSWLSSDPVPDEPTNKIAKADGAKTYSSRADLENKVDKGVADVRDGLFDLIPKLQGNATGPLPDNPDNYAPFPKDITVSDWEGGGNLASLEVSPDFGPFESKAFTNEGFRYVFETSSNIVNRTIDINTDKMEYHSEEWEINVDEVLYYENTYDGYREVMVYFTNSVEKTADESWTTGGDNATTNLADVSSLHMDILYFSDTYDEPQETCSVPSYYATNDFFKTFGTDRAYGSTNVYYEAWWGGVVEPGFDYSSTNYYKLHGYREFYRDRYEDEWGYNEQTNKLLSTSVSSNCVEQTRDIPTSEAICYSNQVVTVPGMLMIDFSKAGDSARYTKAYLKWTNPFGGADATQDIGYPVEIGSCSIGLSLTFPYYAYECELEGPTNNVQGHADCGIITQTDWQWKNLKRTDQ